MPTSSRQKDVCHAESGLLAVDLGLKTGLALYGDDGRLKWYRSRHFGTRERLRSGVRTILEQIPDLTHLVMEGGGPIADIWAAAARRRSLKVLQIAAETWRDKLLPPRGQRTTRDAKSAAIALARRVIEDSGLPRPTALRHDAAEAILIGHFAVESRPWRS
jgi:hypothetical protein